MEYNGLINNINTSNATNTNNNTTNSTSVSTATNVNQNTNNNTNNNTSVSTTTSNSTSFQTTNSVSDITAMNQNNNVNSNSSVSNSTQRVTQKVESPPPSAIAPSIGSSYSQDLCTTGISGAVQTQILGFSTGKSVRDVNCERIKLGKTLYDMGMRVAAVSLMCQDYRVWASMMSAGTPCPYDGKIGDEAKALWEANPDRIPEPDRRVR
jgi:cytoskeletal protein RodZ